MWLEQAVTAVQSWWLNYFCSCLCLLGLAQLWLWLGTPLARPPPAKWSHAVTGAAACSPAVCGALKNASCQVALFFALQALIRREGARTHCQQADNIALIYTLFASVKFSIAAVNLLCSVFILVCFEAFWQLLPAGNRSFFSLSRGSVFLSSSSCVGWPELHLS